MTKPLVTLTVQSPGFLGLNTQQSGSILPVGWATKLDNFSFDDVGRIAARRGTRQLGATVATGSPVFKQVHEYIDSTNTRVRILSGDNKLWKEVTGTYTDITNAGITTPTADDWQFVNFNGWCVGFQTGHVPCITTSASSPDFDDFVGVNNTNFFKGNCAASAYGRLWTHLDNTLYYSDLLIADFDGGSSGNFDLSKYWPAGMDECQAIVDFNGLLVVFGLKSIIVYQNADDVENMSIVEGIDGIGCIARDSIQVIGKDVIFLSDSGVRSLGRSLSDEAMPLTDLSFHVRENLTAEAIVETAVGIKSMYNPIQGYYLLSFPDAGVSWQFDLKFPNEDQSLKVSKWTIAPTAMLQSQDHVSYAALTAGFLSYITGYSDEANSTGLNGTAYTIDYEGVWNDFADERQGNPPQVAPLLKILKRVNILGHGSATSGVTFKWAVDYEGSFSTRPITFNTAPPAQYGVALYDTDVYGTSGEFERVRSNMSRAGQVIKTGLYTSIDGEPFAIQKLDVLAKIGKIGI